MKRILVGDIGSTKGHWAWLSSGRRVTFTSVGYNPVQHSTDNLDRLLREVREQLPADPDRVYWYGSGVGSVEVMNDIENAVQDSLGVSETRCESDLVGAARSVSAGSSSIVCILGTGSNSCVFDGEQITNQIPSLGFPLGDEGGGADIGRSLVRSFYYGMMPREISLVFAEKLPSNRMHFIEEYRGHAAPGRLLASLVPSLLPFTGTAFVRSLLQDSFRTFARLHILPYKADLPVHTVGGIASAFKVEWQEVLRELGCKVGRTEKSPLPGLIEFHTKD